MTEPVASHTSSVSRHWDEGEREGARLERVHGGELEWETEVWMSCQLETECGWWQTTANTTLGRILPRRICPRVKSEILNCKSNTYDWVLRSETCKYSTCIFHGQPWVGMHALVFILPMTCLKHDNQCLNSLKWAWASIPHKKFSCFIDTDLTILEAWLEVKAILIVNAWLTLNLILWYHWYDTRMMHWQMVYARRYKYVALTFIANVLATFRAQC